MAPWLHGSLVILFSILILCYAKLYCAAAAHRRHKKPKFCGSSELDDSMTFLWTIKKEPPVFFFGTIHVPYTRVWDYIPENTKRAFEMSEKIFFELDLTNPFTISALTNCQMLPDGKSLSEVLPREIYDRLKSHLDYVKLMMPSWMTADQRGRGLYADYLFNAITGNWERKRPIWVMLMVNSLTENDIKSRGVPVLDLYLAQEAEKMNKNTGAVERVEEQCIPLNKLKFSQVLFALNQTLHQQERIRFGNLQAPYKTDDLIKHYNCGNLNSVIFSQDTAQVPIIANSSIPPMDIDVAQNIDEYFRSELIYKRNRRMARRVDELLQSYPDQAFFFAFGAGHFLGNYTVLDVLQEQGYHIEHVPATQRIKLPRKWRRRRKEQKFNQDFGVFSDITVKKPKKRQRPQVSYIEQYSNGRPRISHKVNYKFRTSTPSVKRSNKNRNFNDLWIRLESFTPAPVIIQTTRLPRLSISEDKAVMQHSLRLWYGDGLKSGSTIKLANSYFYLFISSILYTYLYKLGSKFHTKNSFDIL